MGRCRNTPQNHIDYIDLFFALLKPVMKEFQREQERTGKNGSNLLQNRSLTRTKNNYYYKNRTIGYTLDIC